MPIGAKTLMEKYDIPEGKNLGNKLKLIEEEWVNNNFKISDFIFYISNLSAIFMWLNCRELKSQFSKIGQSVSVSSTP